MIAGGRPADDHGLLDDERALVERARTDRDAFAELYRRHVFAVHALASRIGGSRDVADEATSATFERALRSIGGFEWRDRGIRPWLLRIASNEVTEIQRRRLRSTSARAQAALGALLAGDANDVADASTGEDDAQLAAMRRALVDLNPRYRDALTLRYLGGLSAADAAAALGCTKPVLAVTVHRALSALRRAMTDDATEGGDT